MPMGVVNDTEFEKQISNVTTPPPLTAPVLPSLPNTTKEAEVIEQEARGRKEGDNNVPDGLRKLIAGTAATEGRAEALALARMFNVSDSSASAYSNGATSTKTYHEKKPDILGFIGRRKARASKRALLKLNSAIEQITDDKLAIVDAKDLSVIAKNMAAVVKTMEPENSNDGRPPVIFQLFAPPIREESSFDIIEVPE